MTQSRIRIRPYRAADAPSMARLYFDSVRELGSRRYSPEQVAAWAPEPPSPAKVNARAGDGRVTLIAERPTGELMAYGDLERDGHIDHLYRHPAAEPGAAQTLLLALIDRARADGVDRLYVEASELARGLFERNGFIVQRRRDLSLRGVAIHNFAMERRL